MSAGIYLSGSVGDKGANRPADVKLVQYLLNAVPPPLGGPSTKLAIDRIAGPKTIGAIRHFQFDRFWFHDGRVDPKGKTQGALYDTVRTHNPANLMANSHASMIGSDATWWRFRSMASVTVGTVAGGIVGSFVADNDKRKSALKIEFAGVGVSLGFVPIDLVVGTHGIPSLGSRFYLGRNKNWGIDWHPFQNFAAIVSVAAGAIAVGGVNVVIFGLRPGLKHLLLNLTGAVLWPLALYNLLEFLSYHTASGAIAGRSWGVDSGISVYPLTLKSIREVPYKAP